MSRNFSITALICTSMLSLTLGFGLYYKDTQLKKRDISIKMAGKQIDSLIYRLKEKNAQVKADNKVKELEDQLGKSNSEVKNLRYRFDTKLSELEKIIKNQNNNIKSSDIHSIQYYNFLKLPNALEFKKELGENFDEFYLKKYIELLKNPKALELTKVLEDYFSNFNLEPYIKFLKNEGSIENVAKVKKLMGNNFRFHDDTLMFLLNPKSMELIKLLKEFQDYYVDEYSYLLDLDMKPDIIAKIPCYELNSIVKDLRQCKIPSEFIPYFTHSPEEYSIKVAGKNPIFGSDREKIRHHIKKKLKERKHCYRLNTDYRGDISQIDSINSINILYLIKGYINYFDKEENAKEIFRKIDYDLNINPYSEEGFLVVDSDEGYKLIRYNSRDFELKNLENNDSYVLPEWFKYIGHVGVLHFHAVDDDNTKFSGPSGSANSNLKLFNGDIGVLRIFNEVNPYEIHCVVTKLKNDCINVDLYFCDVILNSLSEKKNSKTVFVLDLGVYYREVESSLSN